MSRDLLEQGHSVLLCANDDYGLEKLLEHELAEFSLIDLNKIDRVRRALKNSGARVIVNCSCDDFNLKVTKLALELLGPEAPLSDDDAPHGGYWQWHQLRSRGNTIEAGTSEILRNIVAERVLGLPRGR